MAARVGLNFGCIGTIYYTRNDPHEESADTKQTRPIIIDNEANENTKRHGHGVVLP